MYENRSLIGFMRENTSSTSTSEPFLVIESDFYLELLAINHSNAYSEYTTHSRLMAQGFYLKGRPLSQNQSANKDGRFGINFCLW